MKVGAIILAGGKGLRFGGNTLKQFINLNGKPVIEYAVEAFRNSGLIDYITIVTDIEHLEFCAKYADFLAIAGDTRNQSTYSGLSASPRDTDYILTHDAIRPFVDTDIIKRCLDALKDYDAVDTYIPIADTIIKVNDENEILSFPKRSELRSGQTPQAFKYDVILKAYETPDLQNFTCDVGVALSKGIKCTSVLGSEWNIKITTPVDLFIAERILQFREASQEKIDVENKNILVFGGSGGIGSSVVRQLREHGAIVLDVKKEFADLSLEYLPGFLYQNRWDSIINCAGIVYKGYENFNDIFNVNVRSAVLIADLAKKTMLNGGNITFIGSSSAMKGRKEFPLYSASKAALNNLTEGMAEDLKPLNIRVNCINPSRTNTPMSDYLGVTGSNGLSAEYVAKIIIGYCTTLKTGQIINIRKGVNDL